MRDQERIKPVLEALEEYWNKNPDLRLGQIIVNMGRACGYYDPFFVEDDIMLEAIKYFTQDAEQTQED